MKKVTLSLATIALVAVMAVGATYAVFSSSASITDNTFATGTLEIRINGEPSVVGFNVDGAYPGYCTTEYMKVVNNYGDPYFAGPSTLPAEELVISAVKTGGSQALYDALEITVETNRGWASRMDVFDGQLKNLNEADMFDPRWTELLPGHSQDMWYTVCLPASAGNSLQGKTTTFDLKVDAYTPHR